MQIGGIFSVNTWQTSLRVVNQTFGTSTNFQSLKSARSEGAYRCSEMVARKPAAEVVDGRLALARPTVSVHRQTTPRTNGLRILVSHHPRLNETATRHSTGTCRPVSDDHRPKELVRAAIVNAGNKNKRELRELPQLPSYHHPPTAC